ncbi:hypothetical protein KVR01_004391 [Diaporthe batatas]|uniref:uncharacterized protein n=1 Tax=Diaporthe batatas TaxID=748121 RepID=UPI001D05A191|nr:uncharacterized protein KVR01_004391 [Diaporthe batatas]KAG8165839.1 hypothetical protein KVR01_004391 [Diaporthe batatas]
MFALVVAVLAFVLLYNPVTQLLSPAPPHLRRTPRPQVNESLLAVENLTNHTLPCPADSYSVHIVSRAPLVLYVENFLSPEERTHLLDISEPVFEPSTVTHDGGAATHRDLTVRDSEVAFVPRSDRVRCIESRARAFQGWRHDVWVERLRTQRYRPGGHYSHHYDWSSSFGGWGRVSSFMAWVADDDGALEGGGTEFPLLRRPSPDQRWCRFVECDDDDETPASRGVVFKPLAGNAVYWENFRPDGTGRGWEETWHAGLPVTRGTKVGLNIWSWGRID